MTAKNAAEVMDSLDDIDDIYQPDNPMDIVCKLEIDVTAHQSEDNADPNSQSPGSSGVFNPAFDADDAHADLYAITNSNGGRSNEPATRV